MLADVARPHPRVARPLEPLANQIDHLVEKRPRATGGVEQQDTRHLKTAATARPSVVVRGSVDSLAAIAPIPRADQSRA